MTAAFVLGGVKYTVDLREERRIAEPTAAAIPRSRTPWSAWARSPNSRLFARSLAIDEKALEPGHPQLVRARETLADHCREARGLRDAESRDLCRRHGL